MKITVLQSAVIDAPVDRVWEVLRDFSGYARWHPAVVQSRMEDDLDGCVVGGVRRNSLTGGLEVRELLLRLSDREYSLTWCILDIPLPILDYVTTIRLKPLTDGNRTFWDWRSQFRAPDGRAAELENLVRHQLCEAGFTGLRKFLADQEAPRALRSREEPTAVLASAGEELLPSKAVVFAAAGGPEVLSLKHVSVAAPGPRQVRIRHTAVSVNHHDIQYRRGIAAGNDLPGTPGVEGVGKIMDVGEQVHGLFPGDRIAYASRDPGAYADIRCVDAKTCVLLPDDVSDMDAAMFLKGITGALLLSRVFRVARGRTLMIQAVSGGLGHLLSQWANALDLKVIGTVSTVEKAKFIRERGCDFPILVEENTSLIDEVMRITNGRGVDYWVHSSGADKLDTAVSCLTRHGHCAVIGDRDGQPMILDVNVLKQGSRTVSAPVCFDYFDDRSYLERLAHQFFAKIQDRTIIPAVESFPLSQASKAHERIESRKNMGAVVLTPEG